MSELNLIENSFENISLNEAVDATGKKTLHIVGPFIQTEIKNRNGRIYPKSLMESAVNDYSKKYIETKMSMGELNHPESRMSVDPERACILIKELKEDSNDNRYYQGKAKVLSTPLGKLVENLLKDGVTLGVSTRGTGTLNRDTVENFVLKTVDVVSEPSAQAALMNSMMESINDSKDFVFEIESLRSEVEKLKESLKVGSYKEDNTSFIEAIKNLKI